MEHIRLYPLVVLIPYHTFVGYWQSSKAHVAYWKTARPWQILRKQELKNLVTSGDVTLLEATKVTDPLDMSFQDACRCGNANLDGPDPLDTAIDIRESRAFIDTLQ
jgi:hypothetical protein